MEFMFEWEADGDRFSFEDSDRFEEDSLCSWISEPESLCNNWRGWRKPTAGGGNNSGPPQNQPGSHAGQLPSTGRDSIGRVKDGQIPALVELAAQSVAYHIPFEVVERFFPPIPEQLQLRIAFWSFPENEEDIRLYSCLANGSADEFQKGEQLFKTRAVNNALQIGFHLSATVLPTPVMLLQSNAPAGGTNCTEASTIKGACNVALVFDRRHITSCSCTCTSSATWCAHVVALCLFRIHQSSQVCLRAPVSESLSRLERDQLQKFAQYLISELPQQILPTAQRLLDELLSSQETAINTVCGAPDPTAGPSASDLTKWCLDVTGLQENIKKTLSKFCIPSPMVLSDVNYLTNSAPPAATEWQTLLRPLRGREPEGIWNLLSIVREMFRRNDSNAATLLDIITEELLACDQILMWWFNNKTSHNHTTIFHSNRGGGQGSGGGGGGGSSATAPHAAAGLCDEVVTLWRLAALNPTLTVSQRNTLYSQLTHWHGVCLERLRRALPAAPHNVNNARRTELEAAFPGFRPAVEACQLDWTNVALPTGVAELLKHRSHWSQGSAMPNSPLAGVSSGDHSQSDSCSAVNSKDPESVGGARPKETSGRKVLMPSERPSHASVRTSASSSKRSDRECNALSSEVDISISSDTLSPGGRSSDDKLSDGFSSAIVLDDTNVSEPVKSDSQLDILFALAEALHAHGHTKEACKLARQLAEEMLSSSSTADNVISSTADHPSSHSKGDKPRKQAVTSFAGSTLAKVSFLCTVLLEDLDCRHLAFRVGLYGMEMARPPAANKSLEVKLAHQESELANQLKKLPLGPAELNIIRDRAEKLRDGKLKTRGDALLPVTLASFIFDSLCVCQASRVLGSSSQSTACTNVTSASNLITPQDEKLGFEAAVAALGLKANVSEADHPLLCEGTRRQKGELAVAMLVQYKDDTSKLARIMDKLLDKDVHQLYKTPPHESDISNYVGSNAPFGKVDVADGEVTTGGDEGFGVDAREESKSASGSTSSRPFTQTRHSGKTKSSGQAGRNADDANVDDDTEGSGDYKAWEAKFRCTNLRTAKKHSVGMASVDSSAPETTSSDNSPTLVRRANVSNVGGASGTPMHHGGPGSDSGSSHSDSVDSSSDGCKQSSQQPQQTRSSFKAQQPDIDSFLSSCEASSFGPHCVYTRMTGVNIKGSRYKVGKNRIMPSLPNQPSEASAHFMFELAKTVLVKAGGNSSTSLFVNQPPAASSSQTHRALHLCALQIGLYALGLINCVSPNWLSRTYSSHVSWITGQAIEIGYQAIEVLIKTWEGHLTPQEAASLADRASRCRDQNMVRAAADLALSCLPHAHALNPQEIQRALLQCKEQSSDMLQRACLSVENTAKEGGVCPEVLFEVAKRWYELYEERAQGGAAHSSALHIPHIVSAPSVAAAPSSFQDIRDTMAPVSHHSSVPDNMTLMQLSGSNGTPTGVIGGNLSGYPPGSVSFVHQQPLQLMPHPYAQYTYVHPMPPPTQPPSGQARQNLSYYTVPMPSPSQQMHLNRYSYPGAYMTQSPGQAPPSMTLPPPPLPSMGISPTYLPPGTSAVYHPGMTAVRPPPVQLAYLTPIHQNLMPPASSGYVTMPSSVDSVADGVHQGQQPQQGFEEMPVVGAAVTDVHINYLLAAFRVSMLAMDTLAKRVHDDRPQVKYARNPPYGEDVKWLLGISCKLGTSYLQQFCASVVNTVLSPFVLLDVAMEIANYLAINNLGQGQQIRLPMLSSLLQKCLQMFGLCTQTRLHHIAPTDYDDFVSIVCSARNAFCMVPGGMTQFNEMLQSIRRSKSCKKDLWQRVITGLHCTNNI